MPVNKVAAEAFSCSIYGLAGGPDRIPLVLHRLVSLHRVHAEESFSHF